MSWRRILDGEHAAAALDIARDLGGALSQAEPTRLDVGSGAAGLGVALAYLDHALPGNSFGDASERFIDYTLENVNEQPLGPSLFGGLAGIGWAVDHLYSADHDPGGEAAETLAALVKTSPWRYSYDLIGGLVGIGVFFAARLERPGAREALEEIVSRLEELAERPGPGEVTWHTPPHLLAPLSVPKYPQGRIDLGLAHGVPGVIALLARLYSRDVAKARARALLDGAVTWLLRQKLAGQDALFPSIAGGTESARAAWCYGDPGISLALLYAARATGRADWENEALTIARGVTRRPRDQCGVMDGALCHGSAGLLQIFSRLHHATGDESFLGAARAWAHDLVSRREPGRGVAGYRARIGTGNADWADETGLLEGGAGIALALLTAATGTEPNWDEFLLLSPPPV